ncbi:response regulator [Pseudodesulfovibrio piezophilus]|uniref:histidine kinase n=1 Tax=Pseudodesulfovibrio piezophilus (strain DSM 21447 / JCM 15486 / C1TLV30) TaxID=1322246 RepID=M1WPE5_PSEP2|nr:response regulator [Pseudodesulfovibrio piezophilus]CCH48309.1 putative Histidine kinase [Pseudodesulfovibrio piezophilus C1TLV30]
MLFKLIHGSLRKKIIYIVVWATFPVFLVLLLLEFNHRDEAVRIAERDTTLFLHGFSEVQRRITNSTRTLLRTVSELPAIKQRDIPGSTRILETLLKANPIYTNAILLDEHGDVLAIGKGENQGFNFADRKQFRDAVEQKEFSFGEYVIGKTSKKSIFPFGMPVLDESGRSLGALIIGVDLNHYTELFDNSAFPKGAFFGLCDRNGLRLFRRPAPDGAKAGGRIKKEVFDIVRNATKPGIIHTQGSDQLQRIMAYEPLRLAPHAPPYMYMFMGLDRGRVLETTNMAMVQGILASFFSLCVAVLLAWLLAWKSIGIRMNKLIWATRRLGQDGDFQGSGVPYTDGEIGELAEAFDTMSATLKRREEDLLAARISAEAANRAKDEFLANISHEVRTPLNGVMGMLQLLNDTQLDKEQLSFLSTALQSSKNLMRVLNDLLDFIKIGAGKLELLEEVFDLEDLITQSINLFQLQAKEKGLSMTYHIDTNVLGTYTGDVGRLRQVIFNLLGNAIKFTPSGSIKIEVYGLQSKEEEKARLFFAIEDTGVGIPDDKIEYIFDAFTQVDGSLSREYQGTGLGLPIVQKLVNLMEGTCVLESEVGVGTTLLFCVQLKRGGTLLPLYTVKKHQSVSASLRILLVEDEKVNRLMAHRILEKMGHSVECAENGFQCLEKLSESAFDVVLMDIQMPGLDGLGATRAIRTDPNYAHCNTIPIIALSAHAAENDRQTALRAGVDVYLVKPFDKDELEEVLAGFAN